MRSKYHGVFSPLQNQPTKTSGGRYGPKLGQVSGTFSFPLRASHFDGIALENLICDCWAKVASGLWSNSCPRQCKRGLDQLHVERPSEEFDGFVDCIIIESLHNPIADA